MTGERGSTYSISDREMAAGSTLGGPKAMLVIKATGAVERFFSVDCGKIVIGSVVFHHWDEQTGIPLAPLPGTFVIHPHHQEHLFELDNGVHVREDIFVLSGPVTGNAVDPPAAYYTISLENTGKNATVVSTYASVELRGNLEHDVRTTYDRRRRAFVASNAGEPQIVRTVRSSLVPSSYEITMDAGKTSAAHFPGPLSNRTLASGGEPIGIFHYRTALKPGECKKWHLTLSFAVTGRAAALRTLDRCPSDANALARTTFHYETILNRAIVVTPDQEVNRGVLWAKANMLRVLSYAPTGWGFTNDPTRSDNSVARDTAWFAFGADYVVPGFARASLLRYAEHLERSGKAIEYYNLRTGEAADYDLNINDNTPLLILALWHHYTTTGNSAFLRSVYPAARKAASYILSQRNGAGLVWCDASGTADWGIAGWRNVIQNYRLSGATTELNSECYAALLTVSYMARVLGRHRESERFKNAAQALREAINRHLLDPQTGLYYLNIDLDGTPRTDITSDLVFPVMFGVADEETGAHIVSRLSVPDFWSEGGMHTVPRNAIKYGPTHGYGLLGGIWVGVGFWFAFAAAKYNPEFMAYALAQSFRHYSSDPRRNNTVPGQFSEWLHGETLTNQGMMLSPWFPPRYLWAAIEGAGGLNFSADEPSVTPRLAPDWKWLGVRNVPYRGKWLTWLAVRLPDVQMFANFSFPQSAPTESYEEDVTDFVDLTGSSAVTIAFRRQNGLLLFVGNTLDRTTSTAIRLKMDLPGKYAVRSYNTLRGAWFDSDTLSGGELMRGIAIQLDRRGFALLEIRQEV